MRFKVLSYMENNFRFLVCPGVPAVEVGAAKRGLVLGRETVEGTRQGETDAKRGHHTDPGR